jgi:hypothetical protein
VIDLDTGDLAEVPAPTDPQPEWTVRCAWCDEDVDQLDAVEGEDGELYCCEKHAGKVDHDA